MINVTFCNYVAASKQSNRLVWFFVWGLQLFIQWESERQQRQLLCSVLWIPGFAPLPRPRPPHPPRTPIILVYRIPVRPVCKRCVKCNKEPWDYAENVKQLVDHTEAWYCVQRDAGEDAGNVMESEFCQKCSEAVLLLCTLQLMCSALTPIFLYCSLLDTVPNTLHIRSARLLLLPPPLFGIFHRCCLRLSHGTADARGKTR